MTRTKPLFVLLSLATWAVLFLLGAFMLALGWVIVGALVALASIPAAALVAIAGEETTAATIAH